MEENLDPYSPINPQESPNPQNNSGENTGSSAHPNTGNPTTGTYNPNTYNPGAYNPNAYDPYDMANGGQKELPNAVLILVFGIISLPLCCFCGLGVVFAIIALVMANKAREMYFSNPNMYTQNSYNQINAGRICAIIGIVINILYLVYAVINAIMKGSMSAYPHYFR